MQSHRREAVCMELHKRPDHGQARSVGKSSCVCSIRAWQAGKPRLEGRKGPRGDKGASRMRQGRVTCRRGGEQSARAVSAAAQQAPQARPVKTAVHARKRLNFLVPLTCQTKSTDAASNKTQRASATSPQLSSLHHHLNRLHQHRCAAPRTFQPYVPDRHWIGPLPPRPPVTRPLSRSRRRRPPLQGRHSHSPTSPLPHHTLPSNPPQPPHRCVSPSVCHAVRACTITYERSANACIQPKLAVVGPADQQEP